MLVAGLLEKHMPAEIWVDWDGATRTPVTEVTTQVRDQFDCDEIYTVPASEDVVTFPVSGTTEMLDYQASTFSLSGKYGKVSGGNVSVEVVERTLDADSIGGHGQHGERVCSGDENRWCTCPSVIGTCW